MRLFCFSDTHQAGLPACEPAPDAWLCAGDFYDRPDRRQLTEADVNLRNATKCWQAAHPQRVFAVRGNHDTEDKAGFFSASDDLTVGCIRKLEDGLYIAGLGWAGQRYFDLPTEANMAKRCAIVEHLATLFEGRFILLTHYPPHDPAIFPWLLNFEGYYFKCLNKLIETLKPIAVIAGHVHDQFGKIAKIHESTIVFPGPTGKLLNIEGSKVTFEPDIDARRELA